MSSFKDSEVPLRTQKLLSLAKPKFGSYPVQSRCANDQVESFWRELKVLIHLRDAWHMRLMLHVAVGQAANIRSPFDRQDFVSTSCHRKRGFPCAGTYFH